MAEGVLMDVEALMEALGTLMDVVGVGVIVVGSAVATVPVVRSLLRRRARPVYEKYRRDLGRSILLGLEFLVAADIIKTVAITPTFESVGVLAIIVVIRTFLSFSLELEITGRWPWQKAPEAPELISADAADEQR